MNLREFAQTLTITFAAILASTLLFALFILCYKQVSPVDLLYSIYMGGFGSFSQWENTLGRAAPLILTALCTALPARVGLVVIGAEGALVLGGLAAVATGLAFPVPTTCVQTIAINAAGGAFAISFAGHATPPLPNDASASTVKKALEALPSVREDNVMVHLEKNVYTIQFQHELGFTPIEPLKVAPVPLTGTSTVTVIAPGFAGYPYLAKTAMCLAGMFVGGIGIALVGGLRFIRGVNATIASLLFSYIALAVFNYLVEGPFRDPSSLNKPSTRSLEPPYWIGQMFSDIHWGLAMGVVLCLLMYVLMHRTTFGFATRMVGGNVRAAEASGLPVGSIIVITCFLAGACAGLAGAVQVAAVEHKANATLIAGYGFTGILVSFIARHNPLAIIPVAILFGGLGSASGPLQRWLNLPDASVQALMGLMFVMLLWFDTYYGRFRVFMPREVREAMTQ